MKYAFVSAGIIAFGLIGLTLLFLFGALTVNNEQDYYNLKEVTEAAMVESIDIAYYRDTGELKMSQEKFVENFTRRFSASTAAGVSNYDIVFEDIVERPPKVSVLIVTSTGEYTVYGDTQSFDIANKIDAILAYSPNEESNSLGTSSTDSKKWVKKEMKVKMYTFPHISDQTPGTYRRITITNYIKDFIPDELDECTRSDIRNVKFNRVENVSTMKTQAEMEHYSLISRDTYEYDWDSLTDTSNKVAYIQYQAEKIEIGPEDFTYYHDNNNRNDDSDDIFNCSVSNDPSENVIEWTALVDCGKNILPYAEGDDGSDGRHLCGVALTYDIVFTYEQYE